ACTPRPQSHWCRTKSTASSSGERGRSVHDSNVLPLTQPAEAPALATSAVPLGERLAWSLGDLATLTGVSLRHLRRMDSGRDVPGRFTVGRKVLYSAETVRTWVAAGMPDKQAWE